VDIEQIVCALHEGIDAPAFEQAWGRVIGRHPVLRTSFRWQGLEQPIQEVRRYLRCPMEQADWCGLPEEEQEARLDDYLRTDRRIGFELNKAPLMRLVLFRCAEADYKFIWTFHHALLDGRSFPLVLREVFAFYEALRQGQDLQLDHPRPYRDYIEWLQKQDLSRAEAFWRHLLKGFVPPAPLMATKASAGLVGEEVSHGVQQVQLSAELTSALGSLAQQHQVTFNTLVQGAWALVLSRYSGQEDVVFGATRACRRSALEGVGTESMVGMFINTLPVRVRARPEMPVLALLRELRTQSLAVRDYEHTPLVNIQKWSGVSRGAPLFESILVFERYQLGAVLRAQEGDWEHREFRVLAQTNYPLTCVCRGDTRRLLRLVYDRRRFEDAAISRMLGHLQTLLEGMVDNPEQPISAMPLLTEAEHHQLVYEWNGIKTDYPQGQCVHQLVEVQAERAPNAVALVSDDGELTYQEVNCRASQLAHHLQTLGIGPEMIVGIFMERSLEMVIALLGILKSGAAYLPLDPAYPKERLDFLLTDARVPIILTQGKLVTKLPSNQTKVLCLDADWDAIALQPAENLTSQVTADNLAYVIYTSGSTGRPKGVQIGHKGLLNLIFWHRQAFSISPADRATLVAGPAFDASVWELWPYLSAGASIHIPSEEIRVSPERLRDWLVSKDITIGYLPTPLAEAMLLLRWPREAGLRILLTGGDRLHHYPSPGLPFALVNNYGPTENTVVTTSGLVPSKDRVEEQAAETPCIGRPIANTQVYLLDQHLQPVPIGAPGELYIGGDGLARGYLNQPKLTAERFTPNLFSHEPGARLYGTGDLARYRPDGSIEFLGRTDNQAKILGFRIELEEIEVVLAQHPTVQEAVVIAREDRPGDKHLVAYIVPFETQVPSVTELRLFLKQKLPEYMVPVAFVMLPAFPLTPNGKVDRRALPAPDSSQRVMNEDFVSPRSHTEQVLADIWAEVLALEKIGVYDNFFESGGHSLLATQVISRLHEAFQMNLPLRSLFERPTVSSLAEYIETIRWLANPLEAPYKTEMDSREEIVL
jgi:amino acid adenylation domain-containing protein